MYKPSTGYRVHIKTNWKSDRSHNNNNWQHRIAYGKNTMLPKTHKSGTNYYFCFCFFFCIFIQFGFAQWMNKKILYIYYKVYKKIGFYSVHMWRPKWYYLWFGLLLQCDFVFHFFLFVVLCPTIDVVSWISGFFSLRSRTLLCFARCMGSIKLKTFVFSHGCSFVPLPFLKLERLCRKLFAFWRKKKCFCFRFSKFKREKKNHFHERKSNFKQIRKAYI